MNIVICDNCSGAGYLISQEDRYSSYTHEKCNRCNGEGRLYATTIKIEIPFKTDRSKLYALDDDIRKLIYEFKKNL